MSEQPATPPHIGTWTVTEPPPRRPHLVRTIVVAGGAVVVVAALVVALFVVGRPVATTAVDGPHYGTFTRDGHPISPAVHPTPADLVTYLTGRDRELHGREMTIDCGTAPLRPAATRFCRGTTVTGTYWDYVVRVQSDYSVGTAERVSISSQPGLDAGAAGVGRPGQGFPDASPDGFDPWWDEGGHGMPIPITVATDTVALDGHPQPGKKPTWADIDEFALANARAAGYDWVVPAETAGANHFPALYDTKLDGEADVWDAMGDHRAILEHWDANGPISLTAVVP